MMEHINKWVAIVSFIAMLASLQVKDTVIFVVEHPRYSMELVLFAVLSWVGQLVIYTMIKLFKQHIVPFIITTRKLLTIVLSVVLYKHETTFLQILGIVIVFSSVIYESVT